ncbi:AbrB/MazE/SpoVT family DNA-binding domain-containing protein [Limnohabitans sp. 2KL-1]|uniref:AbrB/MazE/SpoVT family DNA-binding domain-containing protein n=1 Tax=Limnohabitans sp. 2KL-1 TaxID=1100699 RepID=UPI002729A182|nr:AbrB/MazE/SpoVT family DNA-binding domain-containing protein [Limnohabitans sp. 2KL-1]
MTITTVFTNNRTQAIRLPADLRLPEGVKRWRFALGVWSGSFRRWGILGTSSF